MATPSTQPKTAPATNPAAPAAKTNPKDLTQLRSMTEKLAYELWEKKGRKHGQDVENWLEAEKIARQKLGL
jgi:Protein of unknown function (DUF2934)